MVAKGGSRNSSSFLVVPMIAAVRLTAVFEISPGRIAEILPSLIAVRVLVPWLPCCLLFLALEELLGPRRVSLPICCTALDVDHQWAVPSITISFAMRLMRLLDETW